MGFVQHETTLDEVNNLSIAKKIMLVKSKTVQTNSANLNVFYLQVYSAQHKTIPEPQSRETARKICLAANYSNLFLLPTTSHCPPG